MQKELKGTKLDLILAAGEIFASKGLKGASIRAIAKKAKVNIAAINYHFGSKENLYKEVLNYIVCKEGKIRKLEMSSPNKQIKKTEHIEGVIFKCVLSKFKINFDPELRHWKQQMLL